jgi:hypothetical protein
MKRDFSLPAPPGFFITGAIKPEARDIGAVLRGI